MDYDDASGYGDSYGTYERITAAGNTFDYPALHGRGIMKAGYSFVSMSRAAACADPALADTTFDGRRLTAQYSAIDLILGKEKQSKFGRPGLHPLTFKTFDTPMRHLLSAYCKAGGAVLVSGSYVGTDLWQNPLVKADAADKQFAKDILKYQWREDRACTWGQIAYVVSPLSADTTSFRYYNKPNSESYVVESPDAIDPPTTVPTLPSAIRRTACQPASCSAAMPPTIGVPASLPSPSRQSKGRVSATR